MVYYLVQTWEKSIPKIIDCCLHYPHRYNIVEKHCQEYGIKSVKSKDEVNEEGLYCIPKNDGVWEVIRFKIHPDGYLLYGFVEEEYQYTLSISFYKIDIHKLSMKESVKHMLVR